MAETYPVWWRNGNGTVEADGRRTIDDIAGPTAAFASTGATKHVKEVDRSVLKMREEVRITYAHGSVFEGSEAGSQDGATDEESSVASAKSSEEFSAVATGGEGPAVVSSAEPTTHRRRNNNQKQGGED